VLLVLIIGVRVSEVLLATLFYVCEVCGNSAAHRLSKRVRRLSLFFLPLFSIGTTYFDSCTACGRLIEISREQAETAAAQTGPELR
jgi:hypothetical protein